MVVYTTKGGSKKRHLTLCRPENGYTQNPRLGPYMAPDVDGRCSELKWSSEEFLGSMKRELSQDSVCRLQSRFSFHPTSSSSLRTFQIDVLGHLIFVKTFLCKMNIDRGAGLREDTQIAQNHESFHKLLKIIRKYTIFIRNS